MKKTALILSLILIGGSQAQAENGATADTTKVNYSEFYDVKANEAEGTKAEEVKKSEEIKTEESKVAPEGLQEQGFKPITQETTAKPELTIGKELSTNPNLLEVNVKNEYPEGVKVVFQDLEDSIELYLNAYETINKVTLNKRANYKIKVFNVYNQYLGYINNQLNPSGQINISPFLLLQDFVDASPNVKAVAKSEPPTQVINQSKTQSTSSSEPSVTEDKKKSSPTNSTPSPIINPTAGIIEEANLKDEFSKNKTKAEQRSKRNIKVANISSSSIHLDIAEPGEAAIGLGWTIPNDLYVPQLLNLKQEAIQITANADLLLTQMSSQDSMHKKASELNLDELGNYILLIGNPPEENN